LFESEWFDMSMAMHYLAKHTDPELHLYLCARMKVLAGWPLSPTAPTAPAGPALRFPGQIEACKMTLLIRLPCDRTIAPFQPRHLPPTHASQTFDCDTIEFWLPQIM